MSTDIVLIGPVRTGKSTLGKLIASELGLHQISLDKFRLQYYKEIGYDEELASEIRDKGGFLALLYYWNLYSAYSVEQILSDYKDCIFDFGAGIYESDEMFWRVELALALYPNVVLVLPSPDKEESLKILAERDRNPPQDLSFDVNRYFLSHHTYYDLAKITIYTRGRTPQYSSKEIIERIHR